MEVVNFLLENGAHIDMVTTPHGATALYIAAQNGHLEVVRLLIQHNADVNKGDSDGYTSLHWAAEKGTSPGP